MWNSKNSQNQHKKFTVMQRNTAQQNGKKIEENMQKSIQMQANASSLFPRFFPAKTCGSCSGGPLWLGMKL
jgi:hypothetical protein